MASPGKASPPFELTLSFKDRSVRVPAEPGQKHGRVSFIEALGVQSDIGLQRISRQVIEIIGPRVCPADGSIACRKVTPNMQCKVQRREGGVEETASNDFFLMPGDTAMFRGHQIRKMDNDVSEVFFPDCSMRDCFCVSIVHVAQQPVVKVEQTACIPNAVVVKSEPVSCAQEMISESALKPVAPPTDVALEPSVEERLVESVLEPPVETAAAESVFESKMGCANEAVESVLSLIVKREECEVLDSVRAQSVQVNVFFPKKNVELEFEDIKPDWEFERKSLDDFEDQMEVLKFKQQVPRKVFRVTEVQMGGDRIELMVLCKGFRCFRVLNEMDEEFEEPDKEFDEPDEGTEKQDEGTEKQDEGSEKADEECEHFDEESEVKGTFWLERHEIVKFVPSNKETGELLRAKALFCVYFVDDGIDLVAKSEGSEESEGSELDGDELEEDDVDEHNIDLNDPFVDIEHEDIGPEEREKLKSILSISQKHLRPQCGSSSNAVVFDHRARNEIMEAHKKLGEMVESVGTAADPERKEALAHLSTVVKDNQECDMKPSSSFEEHNRLLERLYLVKHLEKNPDKSCFGYQPPKPDGDPVPAPLAKKARRTIVPTVVPNDGEAV